MGATTTDADGYIEGFNGAQTLLHIHTIGATTRYDDIIGCSYLILPFS